MGRIWQDLLMLMLMMSTRWMEDHGECDVSFFFRPIFFSQFFSANFFQPIFFGQFFSANFFQPFILKRVRNSHPYYAVDNSIANSR